uniref:Uncharacterized protein n=1 Tax=Picea glauca TaxID=3330 RepID=A0A101LVB1_PICGL|nr:hypothetical protein ABT39_MTgene2122 [Picea glauca]QHR86910.1 hypothetical protein Q903MT_gene917 [Picea sitchensis]
MYVWWMSKVRSPCPYEGCSLYVVRFKSMLPVCLLYVPFRMSVFCELSGYLIQVDVQVAPFNPPHSVRLSI